MLNAQEKYLQVAIPVPMRQLFTYILPQALSSPNVIVGERVLVPFGHRQVIGIVMNVESPCDLSSQVAPEKLKAIISRVADHYHFDKPLLTFLQSCAKYYHHPIGDVLQQALPVALRQIKQPDVALPTVWTGGQTLKPSELALLESKAKKQAALYELIHQHDGLTWPELRTLNFSKAQVNALAKKDLIKETTRPTQAFHWQQRCLATENKLQLSVEQAVIVAAVEQSLTRFSCHLIDGITGSGKTEVYLQAMEKVLAANKQVLVLVPEIGLTPQTLNRFEQRFNVPISLHHSGLNNSERLQTWLEAQRGSAAIVIGTRSAIFTPLHQLGLIIIDEEHDSSFKQQDSFRYHGRDIAILRAQQLNIPIMLGSATPCLETLQNALAGKYHYHQLLQRAGNSRIAKIGLINVSNQELVHGLSPQLSQQMQVSLARGEQVLVFLNRRGYAPAIHCQECQWVADCQRCNKPYTFHQGQSALICHHCGSQKRVPMQCPSCGSVRLTPMGQGTEQLEQKIAEQFSQYNTVRIDRDSTRKKGELAKLLQAVADKEYQLLIGTQMLAKGHHFPDVTLVAILDIDGALFSYDFRAAEHMAQLLVQVSGRAGRASKPGNVLVQTHYPEHPLLQDLVHNGYPHFAQQTLMERKQALLPPFSFQALIRADANYPSYPDKFLREISQYRYDGCQCLGPVPAAMEKKAGKYRYHLILQASSRAKLHQAIRTILANIDNNDWQKKVKWSLDVDPMDLSW